MSENNAKLNMNKVVNAVRKRILTMAYKGNSAHVACALSCVEILVALYNGILNISVENIKNPLRNRFILSKGHGAMALYAVLENAGIVSAEMIEKYATDGAVLAEHPCSITTPGIEFSTGSLGHGPGVACGMAFAAKFDRSSSRIFVLCSDGELNEGSVWEAVLFANAHKLDNLVLIVDHNCMQALGKTDDIIPLLSLAKKFKSFGWAVKEVDGHDVKRLYKVLNNIPFEEGKPSVVIAHTVKGKGVSFMENNLLWHYKPPNEEELKMAIAEIK